MFDRDTLPVWIEFNHSVWTGEAYVDSLLLQRDWPGGENRTLAMGWAREDQHWRFVIGRHHTVLVPDNNVRFVYGINMQAAPVKAGSEDQSDGISEESQHVAENMPKRRGRPPKVQP